MGEPVEVLLTAPGDERAHEDVALPGNMSTICKQSVIVRGDIVNKEAM
ncbi:hypothetical protein [Ktedonospora formicarum]|nr:hypothetical protein [Ktedonospora formicarum]